jgi:hypothetical protein
MFCKKSEKLIDDKTLTRSKCETVPSSIPCVTSTCGATLNAADDLTQPEGTQSFRLYPVRMCLSALMS